MKYPPEGTFGRASFFIPPYVAYSRGNQFGKLSDVIARNEAIQKKNIRMSKFLTFHFANGTLYIGVKNK